MFRVGTFDERLRYSGITHLVEHLALAPLKDTELDFNASVGPITTMIFAHGNPETIGDFLARVCRSLVDLPLDRLDVESEVLLREAETTRTWTYFGKIASAYFGLRGPGLANYRELGLGWLGPNELWRWRGKYFNKSNAILALTGPPPSGWELPLREGKGQPYELPGRERTPAPDVPTLLGTQEVGAIWGALVHLPRSLNQQAVLTSLEILGRRLEDRLRHDLGKAYTVAVSYWRLDADLVYVSLGIESAPENAREVGREFLATIQAFAESGPTAEEIARRRRTLERRLEDYPDAMRQSFLIEEARARLIGWGSTPAPHLVIEAMAQLHPDAVRERFAEAYRQSYFIADLPEHAMARPAPPYLTTSQPTPEHDWSRTFRRKPFGKSGDYRLIKVGRSGVALLTGDRQWLFIPTEDIEIVVFGPDEIFITAARLDVVIAPAEFVGGSGLYLSLSLALPEELLLPGDRENAD